MGGRDFSRPPAEGVFVSGVANARVALVALRHEDVFVRHTH